jgi:ribosome-associated protein
VAQEPEPVAIRGTIIRLGQLLKLAGIAADGGEAKALLEAGHVHVNGSVEHRRGRQLHEGDVVQAAGATVRVAAGG